MCTFSTGDELNVTWGPRSTFWNFITVVSATLVSALTGTDAAGGFGGAALALAFAGGDETSISSSMAKLLVVAALVTCTITNLA